MLDQDSLFYPFLKLIQLYTRSYFIYVDFIHLKYKTYVLA